MMYANILKILWIAVITLGWFYCAMILPRGKERLTRGFIELFAGLAGILIGLKFLLYDPTGCFSLIFLFGGISYSMAGLFSLGNKTRD